MPNTKDTLQNSTVYLGPGKSGEMMCGKRKHVSVEHDTDAGIVQDSKVVVVILCWASGWTGIIWWEPFLHASVLTVVRLLRNALRTFKISPGIPCWAKQKGQALVAVSGGLCIAGGGTQGVLTAYLAVLWGGGLFHLFYEIITLPQEWQRETRDSVSLPCLANLLYVFVVLYLYFPVSFIT